MAVTLLQGPLGKEAVHTWNNILAMNRFRVLPRYQIDRITGLFGFPDAENNAFQATGMPGEIPYPSMIRGKTVIYEGRVIGRSLAEMREQITIMRSAFQWRSAEYPMAISPDPEYGDISWMYNARVLDFDCDEDDSNVSLTSVPTPYQRDFVLTVRMMRDSRFYKVGGVEVTPGVNGVLKAVPNLGYAPVDPKFTIQGPIGDLVIERTTNPGAAKLEFKNMGVGPADALDVDFKTRTVISHDAGLDLMAKQFFATSNWWDEDVWGLYPGNTNVKVSGGGTWEVVVPTATW